MHGKKSRRVVLLITVLALTAAGCGVSDLASAASKLANGQLGSLTAAEIRSLSEAAVAVLNSQNAALGLQPLTMAQAEALVSFLDVNAVETKQDLDALITNADTNPPDGLSDLAAAFGNIDPDSPDAEELDLIFEQALGGSTSSPS
jgi:hypothetical protein